VADVDHAFPEIHIIPFQAQQLADSQTTGTIQKNGRSERFWNGAQESDKFIDG
jgi:hypothetical protein